MKKYILFISCWLITSQAFPQASPVWLKDINAFPDSSAVLPVRTLNDGTGNILVLSTYNKGLTPNVKNKIFLNKYDQNGIPAFALKFDNNGSGQPRGFDMAVDAAGNSYVAGGLMGVVNARPFLLKVGPAGNVIWQRDSAISFNAGYFKSIFLHQNKLYLAGTSGLAQFDLNGNEIWSDTIHLNSFNIDSNGQVLYSTDAITSFNVFRTDSNGIQNFADSTIKVKRIATDHGNNFYLLTDTPQYSLVKYDSTGAFSWSYTFTQAPPSNGDQAMEIICDDNNDVLVIGLNDTMFKFSPSGILKWTRPMGGIDNFFITAKITTNNILALAGAIQSPNGYDLYASWFDLTGIQNWAGYYSSNDSLTEFTKDMSIDNSGVYVLENNDNRSTIVKFESPLATAFIDYTKVCVDSVWYDAGNYNYYNVKLYNGNIANLVNPSVRMVSVFGDTAGNPFDHVNFPLHEGNSYKIYHDTITDPFITNFAPYTFIVEENYGDTLTIVPRCFIAGVGEIENHEISFFPNPVSDYFYIRTAYPLKNFQCNLFNSLGELILSKELNGEFLSQINTATFPAGIYFISISNGKVSYNCKIVKFTK